MRVRWCALVSMMLLVCAVPAWTQTSPDEGEVWSAFVAWAGTAPGNSVRGLVKDYVATLGKEGLTAEEINRRVGVIGRYLSERPEGVEFIYDRIFSTPATGDFAKDGYSYNPAPNSFLVEAVKGQRLGKALDIGAGQGRNAVYLAQQGWEVTAMDISAAGLALARANAEKAGVRITTEKASYDDYDFGVEKWDLMAMILAWVPVEDPAFVARIRAALRPGGVVVFESVVQRSENPFPPFVHAVPTNTLRSYFTGLRIERCEEVTVQGDWGGPPGLLVRMVARK